MPEVIDDVVRRLYEEPPEGFVATRAAAIEAARAAGDRDAAKRLAALKKPTVAAWVVNLLARRRPDLIGDLVELSAALRAAQRELQGDQLRELSQQRRAFVSALVAEARKLAVAAGAGAGKLPLGEVETTLTAALSDPEVAEQVRTGRLIRSAAYAGFGEVPRPRLRLISGGEDADVTEDDEDADASDPVDEPAATGRSSRGDASDPADGPAATWRSSRGDAGRKGAGPDESDPDEAARREAARNEAAREAEARERAARERRRREEERRRRDLERDLAAAEAAERRADEHLNRAEEAERDAQHLVDDLDAELAELERRRTEAVADVARRKQARRTAERESAAARRRVGDVQAALDDLP
ncbi:hypothetical protein ACWT_7603 [Actinoplanes sp. SE50]|uniref:hypothetical protein n=1 Tax=unclassified Actinoplanes TaxID=2626549 RepID=UPI00023EDD7C|nr:MULTISPECIES: hypothetical protein [unclassified Actinoplanes]AEV88614.1 hypothetical protein ACPL_7734 [Actinoplanes sp. SE50/110]ATO87018.1 hypothetical protein ACWT_7603 [Actinoplanes sp. SE50]SLM04436.1 hypothetical protein ACSP50_7741 [Actinoplanes sp. SE50/110]